MFDSLQDLNNCFEIFQDPQREPNKGPFVIVKDNFYSDPDKVRALALKQSFYQYSPPLAEQVGEEVASQYKKGPAAWSSSALLRYWGKQVHQPKAGFRYAGEDVQTSIAAVIGEAINLQTWQDCGDWWNGAFHLQTQDWHLNRSAIHHHYKDGDVSPRGWSGLVYLSPEAPKSAGTSIWREKSTGLCVAGKGVKFNPDESQFEKIFLVENYFNRLVLFRENVLHRTEHGFGQRNDDARLIQTFFFHTQVG